VKALSSNPCTAKNPKQRPEGEGGEVQLFGSWSALAAVTKYHRLDDLTNLFLTDVEAEV
jgi:hypothetical protein